MRRISPRIFVLLAFVVLDLSVAPAFANTWAVGGFTAHNFTTNTVVGLKVTTFPYNQNQVAWGGTDKGLLFVESVFTPWSETQPGVQAFQVLLMARASTKMMDISHNDPSGVIVADCVKCADGTTSHTLQIVRSQNGFGMFFMDYSVDGTGYHTANCGSSCPTNDNLDQGINQEPIAMEVSNGETQADIDNSFQIGTGSSISYEKAPVGSGTWLSVAHAYFFYTNTGGCTDSQIGDTVPPTWAAVNGNGPQATFQMGTTTHLTRATCGGQLY